MKRLVVGVLLLASSGCSKSYEYGYAEYEHQAQVAEAMAAAHKDHGKWTPEAIRRLSMSLSPGNVAPVKALAECGCPVGSGVISTVAIRSCLEAQADRLEQMERIEDALRQDKGRR